MKKFKLILILVVAIILTTGCSVSFKNSNQQPVVIDGGLFKSANKGTSWAHSVLVPTITGQPQSIGTLSVYSLAMDPSDRNALYYGSLTAGLFYSYDGANSWQPASSLGSGKINDVKIDPESKCIIYAAITNRLYKSTDCNRSWTKAYFDDNVNVVVSSIAIDHYDSTTMFIGTSRGEIIRSNDRGVSWTTLYRFNDNLKRIVIDPNDSRRMFVVTQNKGIFRSYDRGINWVSLKENLKEFRGATNFKDIVLVPGHPGIVYSASGYGLLRSEDSGESWVEIELIPPSQNATINAVAVNPEAANEIFYVTNTTFYRSYDGGESWTTFKLPTSKAGWRLILDPEDANIIYLGVTAAPI